MPFSVEFPRRVPGEIEKSLYRSGFLPVNGGWYQAENRAAYIYGHDSAQRAVAMELYRGLYDDHRRGILHLQEMVKAASSYGEDLAYIHDAGFSDLARNAATTLLKLLQTAGIRSGLVVDLGCGSGVLAEKLTSAGYDVLRIDISECMLELARKRAPRARFVRRSLFRAKFPKCIAVTAVGESINYLLGAGPRPSLSKFLARVYEAIDAGGFFLFDIATTEQFSAKTYSQGRNWVVLIDKIVNRRWHLLLRRMIVLREVGKLYRRTDETHTQRLYSPREVAEQLKSAGFKVRQLSGYNREQFGPGRAGFLARKP